jgi:hypothetical protein
MERALRFLACTAIAGTLYGAGLYAQVMTYSVGGPGQPGAGPVISGRMMTLTGGDMERVVKSAPFSAQAVTTTTQVLGDGNRIVQTSETTLARDGEGRTRREISVEKLGPWSTDTTGRVVIIRDRARWPACAQDHGRRNGFRAPREGEEGGRDRHRAHPDGLAR